MQDKKTIAINGLSAWFTLMLVMAIVFGWPYNHQWAMYLSSVLCVFFVAVVVPETRGSFRPLKAVILSIAYPMVGIIMFFMAASLAVNVIHYRRLPCVFRFEHPSGNKQTYIAFSEKEAREKLAEDIHLAIVGPMALTTTTENEQKAKKIASEFSLKKQGNC